MPISREEFEAGRVDLAVHVRALLQDHLRLAFTGEDVQQAFQQGIGREASLQEVVEALESLVAQGQAEAKDFAGHRWYTVKVVERRIGFRG